MKGGQVEFEFKGNTKDVESKVDGLSDKLKSFAKGAGVGIFASMTAATTVLVKSTSEAVKAHGELEQQIGGTEAVFGSLASTVQTQAVGAFSKMGVSANEYMATMNKMGSLMKGSGIDTQKAMDLSSQAMQRAADVASVMGISTESAMEAIAGAAKGNFTMMDNLGVAMNATSLSAYALEKGLNKTYQEMSQGEKIELAMQMFMEKSADAAGNYAKENKTFAGSLNTVRMSFKNLLSGAGTVQDFMSSLSGFVQVLVQNLQTILPQVAQGVIALLQGLIPIINESLPLLIQELLPVFLQGVTSLVVALIEILPDLITMIADMLPTLIPQIIEAIMTIIPALVENFPALLAAGVKFIGEFIKGCINGFATLLGKIGGWVANLVNKIKETGLGKILNVGKQLVTGLWNGISNSFEWIKNKIKGWVGNVMSFIKKLFGIGSPSKEFAIIGRYNIMGLENGMEEESLKLQDGFEDMFSLSPNLYGTAHSNLSPQINVFNEINMKQDNLGQMVNDIKTFSGGAKNDYSYGMGA